MALDGDLGYEDNCVFGPYHGPAFLFPYSSGVKARWKSAGEKKIIRWILGGPNGQYRRQSSLRQDHSSAVIAEGETDVVSGISASFEEDGHLIVLGLAGATILPAPEAFKGREVIIVPDPDNAGKQSERKLRDLLAPIARAIHTFDLEEAFL